MSALPLSSSLCPALLRLTALHNLVLQLAFSRSPELLLLQTPLPPSEQHGKQQTTRSAAQAEFVHIAESIRRSLKKRVKARSDWEAQWKSVDHAHPLYKSTEEDLDKAEQSALWTAVDYVTGKLKGSAFGDEYCRMMRKMLVRFKADPKLDRTEYPELLDIAGLGPRGNVGELIAAGTPEDLLMKLVDALIILHRAQPTPKPSAKQPEGAPSRAVDQLYALSSLVRSFTEYGRSFSRQMYARGRGGSRRQAEDALLLIADEVARDASEIEEQWAQFRNRWESIGGGEHPLKGEEYKNLKRDERKRLENMFGLVAQSLSRPALEDEYLLEANNLLRRFKNERGLDKETKEEFREMVGLRRVKKWTTRDKIKAGQDTIELLRVFLDVRAIDNSLPPPPRARGCQKVLRGDEGRSDGRRKARELGVGEEAGAGGAVMCERKRRMYQI